MMPQRQQSNSGKRCEHAGGAVVDMSLVRNPFDSSPRLGTQKRDIETR